MRPVPSLYDVHYNDNGTINWREDAKDVRTDYSYDSKGNRKRIDDTTAHRDHIHIGMTKAGAKGRTSFWTAG